MEKMEMNLNADLIITLRQSKAWSQQHLSDVSKLSLRTVQRVERTGKASSTTIRSLAKALEIPTEELLIRKSEHILSNTQATALKSNHLKAATLISALFAMIIAVFTFTSLTHADEIEIQASEAVHLKDDLKTIFEGDVKIVIPENKYKSIRIENTELTNIGSSRILEGDVTVEAGSIVINVQMASLLKVDDKFYISTNYAEVVTAKANS